MHAPDDSREIARAASASWLYQPVSRPRRVVAWLAALVAVLCLFSLVAPPPMVRDAEGPGPHAEAALAAPEPTPADAADRKAALHDLRAMRVASRALSYLRLRYVDPDKLQAPAMLEEALQSVAHLVPEMLVDTPRKPADGTLSSLRVRIGEASLRLPLAGLDDLYRLNWQLLAALRFVADHLPDDVTPRKVEYVAINGMLSTLDPYSRMLDPDAWRDMQTHTGGNFGGLGIVILAQEGFLTIQSVIPGSPAERAGLQSADQIHQIDGEDTLNMGVDDAVERLRGEVGTAATLMVRRQGWPKAKEFVVVRAVIHLQSVEWKVLDNGIGYAKIKNFQRGTADELAIAVEELQRSGSQNGLVLDLRDNPGGLLDEAIRVVDLFLTSGPAVITVTGGRRQRDERPVSGRGRFARMHLAVLQSGHSASAAEVVAGALKYSGRAIVLGEQSFGKASVQVPYEIDDGALKLTVAKYLVPGDVNIHGVGITPDIGLQFVSATREQIHLFGGPRYSRALRRSRASQGSQPPPIPRYHLRILLPDAQTRLDEAVVEGPVEVMEREPRNRAADLLRRSGDVRAAVMLASAQADLAEMAHQDDLALTAHLKKQGIDWRAGPPLGAPLLRVQVADPAGLLVHAGEVLRMSVTLQNLGREPLHRLHIQTTSDDPALDGHEQLVGRLEPGQGRTVHLRMRISMRHADLLAPMQVRAAQDGVLLPVQHEVVVAVRGRPAPDFACRTQLDDARAPTLEGPSKAGPAAEVDGLLQPGETAYVRIEVRNRGEGLSQGAVVSLRSLSGQRLHLDEARVRLPALAPGGEAVARLAIRGTDMPAGRGGEGSGEAVADFAPVRAELTIADEALGIERRALITLPWGRKPLAKAPRPVADALRTGQRQAAEAWDGSPRIQLLAGAGPDPRVPGLLTPLTGACKLQLAGLARFDALAPRRRFVTASVAGVKQIYRAGHGQTEVPFEAPLRLDSGLNTVTIQAQAGPHQLAERTVLVHCQRTPAGQIAAAP